jgi:WD40 repeat protein
MLQSYHAPNAFQVTINTQVSCMGASPLGAGIGVIVAGCSNGSFRIYSQSLKEEKLVSGHSASIMGISWAADGSEFLTASLDGSVKLWSRSGAARRTVAQSPDPVLGVCWSPDGNSVAYITGNRLCTISVIEGSENRIETSALILSLDWSDERIVTGREDGVLTVHSPRMRIIEEIKLNCRINSIKIHNNEIFLGIFQQLLILNSKTLEPVSAHTLDPGSGTITSISIRSDSRVIVVSSLLGGTIVLRRIGDLLVHGDYQVELIHSDSLRVNDEIFSFKNNIKLLSINFNHLIIFCENLNLISIDLNENLRKKETIIDSFENPVVDIVHLRGNFVLKSNSNEFSIFNLNLRRIKSINIPNANCDFATITAEHDIVAVSGNEIIIYRDNSIIAKYENIDRIRKIDSNLIFLDNLNYLTIIHHSCLVRLRNSMDDFRFIPELDCIVSINFNNSIFIHLPPFGQNTLEIPLTHLSEAKLSIIGIQQSNILVLKHKNSFIYEYLNNFVFNLIKLINSKNWQQCIKLCRQAESDHCWRLLAYHLIDYPDQLDLLETCYANLNDVARVLRIIEMKTIQNKPKLQRAHLLLYISDGNRRDDLIQLIRENRNNFSFIKILLKLEEYEILFELISNNLNFQKSIKFKRKKSCTFFGITNCPFLDKLSFIPTISEGEYSNLKLSLT